MSPIGVGVVGRGIVDQCIVDRQFDHVGNKAAPVPPLKQLRRNRRVPSWAAGVQLIGQRGGLRLRCAIMNRNPPALAVQALHNGGTRVGCPVTSTTGSLPVTMATPHPALHPAEAGLPPPSPVAAEHGARVLAHLRAQIAQAPATGNGSGRFHSPIFMQQLYAPNLGLLRGGRRPNWAARAISSPARTVILFCHPRRRLRADWRTAS